MPVSLRAWWPSRSSSPGSRSPPPKDKDKQQQQQKEQPKKDGGKKEEQQQQGGDVEMKDAKDKRERAHENGKDGKVRHSPCIYASASLSQALCICSLRLAASLRAAACKLHAAAAESLVLVRARNMMFLRTHTLDTFLTVQVHKQKTSWKGLCTCSSVTKYNSSGGGAGAGRGLRPTQKPFPAFPLSISFCGLAKRNILGCQTLFGLQYWTQAESFKSISSWFVVSGGALMCSLPSP